MTSLKEKKYFELPNIVSSGSNSKGIGLSGKFMAFIPSSCSSDTERKEKKFSEFFFLLQCLLVAMRNAPYVLMQ